jgi:hypothetical protein
MSFHRFDVESYWDYYRSYRSSLRKDAEAKAAGKTAWGVYQFDAERSNHPHYSGMYGAMQEYFTWFDSNSGQLTAEDGYYFMDGHSEWGGFGANRDYYVCWQFHRDDWREYVDWEWKPLPMGPRDFGARQHFRKRFEYPKAPKPKVRKGYFMFNWGDSDEEVEEKPAAIKLFM